MTSFAEILLLSVLMGFSIFLSVPIILKRNLSQIKTKLLNATAIGILIFLIGDVFLDAAQSLGVSPQNGLGSTLGNDLTFTLSLAAGFFVLFFFTHRRKVSLTPTEFAFIIALGISFQNLTEGLLFGSLGVSIGLTGAALVVLVGFILQNVTEGFPIVAPFLGATEGKGSLIAGVLLIGGLPTIFGGAFGYYYNTASIDLVFYGLAIGTMLFVILPMLRGLLWEADATKVRVAYAGIFLGFVLGFIVNLL